MKLSFVHEITVKRWQQSIQIMLPKTENAPTLNKLRNIQLIEADLNGYLKIKGNKQLIENGEKFGVLEQEMFGGRKNKSTHMALITQTLINDNTKICSPPPSHCN